MKICVLNAANQESAAPFAPHDPMCSPARYAPEHEWSQVTVRKATAGSQIRAAAARADLFFNLCDGAWDEDRAGIDVVRILETLGVPFTGANSRFYEPTRDTMKRVCRYYGVDTPAWRFAANVDDAVAAVERLRFPMILKHPESYASIGMTKDSRVTTVDALAAEAARFVGAFGSVLIEEFIEGREFTVLVSERAGAGASDDETDCYPPMECRFPPGETFKHFDLKWIDFNGIEWLPVGDTALSARLQELSSRIFVGLGGSGYGRADLRSDRDGRVYLLEMNAQPGVFYPDGSFGSADTILANDPGGHTRFVHRVIDAAMARSRRRRPAFEIRDNGRGGYGMIAARDLAAGDLIDGWEGRPQRLVSRAHAEAWTGRAAEWFRQYAWPIGDDVYVIWAEDPADWRPIDHSCEPNAWMTGLDLVARTPIPKDAVITCDYGTFCDEIMVPFACGCGEDACRGEIRGTDYLLPRMAEYGTHVSPWVAARRQLSLI